MTSDSWIETPIKIFIPSLPAQAGEARNLL